MFDFHSSTRDQLLSGFAFLSVHSCPRVIGEQEVFLELISLVYIVPIDLWQRWLVIVVTNIVYLLSIEVLTREVLYLDPARCTKMGERQYRNPFTGYVVLAH